MSIGLELNAQQVKSSIASSGDKTCEVSHKSPSKESPWKQTIRLSFINFH